MFHNDVEFCFFVALKGKQTNLIDCPLYNDIFASLFGKEIRNESSDI